MFAPYWPHLEPEMRPSFVAYLDNGEQFNSLVTSRTNTIANMPSNEINASFEDQEEWASFSERNQAFLRVMPEIERAINIAFVREIAEGSRLDVLLLSLGRLCAEEFMEILLLCGHGYGIAATRSLRGMYERAVTARYLHDNPRELEAFAHYGNIATYKLMKQIQATMGDQVVPPEIAKKLEESYQEYRNEFLITDCKKCGTQKMNYSWSKLDFVSMAAKTSLGIWIVPGYYLPTQEIHSTVGAISSRVQIGKDRGLTFGGGQQRAKADVALITAHNIIIFVLELQKEHFNLAALEQPLQKCKDDFELLVQGKNSSDTPA